MERLTIARSLSWHCYHTAVGAGTSLRLSWPGLPICRVRGRTRWSWHSLPASGLNGSLMSEYPTGLGKKAQNSGKEGTVSEYGPFKDLKFKNWGGIIHLPIWLSFHPCPHLSTQAADDVVTVTRNSIQHKIPTMYGKALWKKERSEHFSLDLGVTIPLLYPWNQAKLMSGLTSALDSWVTSESLFDFSKSQFLICKTRISAMPPPLDGCDIVVWVLRIEQGTFSVLSVNCWSLVV